MGDTWFKFSLIPSFSNKPSVSFFSTSSSYSPTPFMIVKKQIVVDIRKSCLEKKCTHSYSVEPFLPLERLV